MRSLAKFGNLIFSLKVRGLAQNQTLQLLKNRLTVDAPGVAVAAMTGSLAYRIGLAKDNLGSWRQGQDLPHRTPLNQPIQTCQRRALFPYDNVIVQPISQVNENRAWPSSVTAAKLIVSFSRHLCEYVQCGCHGIG